MYLYVLECWESGLEVLKEDHSLAQKRKSCNEISSVLSVKGLLSVLQFDDPFRDVHLFRCNEPKDSRRVTRSTKASDVRNPAFFQ